MKRLIASLLFLLLPALASHAQQASDQRPVSVYSAMSGFNYSPDAVPEASQAAEPLPEAPYRKKSPILAGAMSLVLPGAGQVYAESYWTAALFATLEAAGWYFVVDQNSRGDDATTRFEQYADQHWSVADYATWLNTWAKTFPGGEQTGQITISDDETRVPWERVNWAEMNEVEMAIPQFSHRLPAHGDQQYFEMIGKYNQYSSGWDDYTSGRDYYSVSPRYLHYSGMRGDANSYYDAADTFVNLIILNHVLAGVEAAWAAARFNKFVELYSHTRLRQSLDGRTQIEPTIGFAMKF